MTGIQLQHEDGKGYRPDKVSVQYDGRIDDLQVDDEGGVEAANKKQAEVLQEQHDGFFLINDKQVDEDGYVLEDLSVSEVEQYLEDVEDVGRLKELRRLESSGKDRKTAKKAIDDRIKQVDQQ